MKKFLKNKSKNQENTTRKINKNSTVDKKEKTYIMKNNSNKQRRRRRGRRNPRNNYSRTIKLNMGFSILKIIVIVLFISLIAALTVRTVMIRIGTKESTSETGNEGIASIAEIDVQSILSDDESYSTVTITSNYPIIQIEVSEEDYNEDLEEEDYTFVVEDDWEVTEEGLVLTKDFAENIDKAYRLTFEDETYIIQEIIIEDFHSNENEDDEELEGEATLTSTIDEDGNVNYDDEVSTASVSVSKTGISSVGAATLNTEDYDLNDYTSFTVSGSLGKTSYTDADDGWTMPIVYVNASSLSAGSSLTGTITLKYSGVGVDSTGTEVDVVITDTVTFTNTRSSAVSWTNSSTYRFVVFVGHTNAGYTGLTATNEKGFGFQATYRDMTDYSTAGTLVTRGILHNSHTHG